MSPKLTEETVDKAWQEIYPLIQGKKVLIISHQKRFRILWRYLFGIEADIINDKDLNVPYLLANTEIVKMPTLKIENELDQRILAEAYKMLAEVDTALETYELEPATKALMNFMEKLTNWYLRRSRRRFRASGMDTDKQAAYATLREVLRMYLKVAAPFAPFMTESIWLEMEGFSLTPQPPLPTIPRSSSLGEGEDVCRSVHLEYRPLGSAKYINETLIDEIATVRKVIKGAMYLRAKHQIKVKQPLQELKFKI